MPLENPDVVDLVSVSATGDEVTVHIIANEPWDEQQLFQLQAKLKNTVAFTADGQLDRMYPEFAGKSKIIEIRADFPPSEAVEKLIAAARQKWCAPEGIKLSFVVPEVSGAV
jgi:Family of unknown function (DUF6572)